MPTRWNAMPRRPVKTCGNGSGAGWLVVGLCAAWLAAPSATSAAESPIDEDGFEPPHQLHEKAGDPANPSFASAGLSPFQPASVSGRTRRTLLQFDALTADGAWDDAIDLVERLQAESGDELTERSTDVSPLADAKGHEVFVPINERCQRMLAALGPEGLEAYRARVDRSARERVDDASARLDEAQLRRVVRELFASRPTADALLALGELALERGDTAAARRHYNRLHPLLWGPYGRPAGASLVTIQPGVAPTALGEAWRTTAAPTTVPVAPADEELLRVALARLALTSLREGDLRRAAAETRLLRGLAPGAEGRLAGRTQPLADALDAMRDEQESAGSTGSPSTGLGKLAWAWRDPVQLEPEPEAPVVRTNNQFGVRINALGQRVLVRTPDPAMVDDSAPHELPVAVDGLRAFYVEGGAVRRLDLRTGETTPQAIPGVESPKQDATPRPGLGDVAAGRFIIGGARAPNGLAQLFQNQPAQRATRPIATNRIDPSLAFSDGVLYARVISAQAGRNARLRTTSTINENLVGVRPDATDGEATRFFLPTDDPQAEAPGATPRRFTGRPTLRGDRLYVVLTRPGVRTEIAVACYSASTGRLLWSTDIGSGEAVSRVVGANPAPPVVAGDTLYLATNLGSVAALEATTGRVRWIARYPREGDMAAQRSRRATEPSPCVLVGDRLVAAPEDSTRLIAWDAGTGQPLWDARRSDDAAIAGVVDSPEGAVVVLAGRQLASYDSHTGQRRFLWPESPRAGLRGLGAAAVFGGAAFWPTRDAIYVIDPTTGAPSHPPIDLTPVGSEGANVVATDYGLLVCGAERLRLLVSLEAGQEPSGPQSRLREAGPSRLAAKSPSPPAETPSRGGAD